MPSFYFFFFWWKKNFIDQNQPRQEEILFKKELQLQTKSNWEQLIFTQMPSLTKSSQTSITNNFLQVVIPLHSKRV
jgi:hypothetical protein